LSGASERQTVATKANKEASAARTLGVQFDERKVDAIFAGVDQCHLPGVAVGIAIEGKPVYRKGFGLASMELPTLLSPSIRMRIASTSKHFTCLAYLLLCEEGGAGIDDPVGRHLPELNPVAHGVTMRQLMGNTGGLRDVYDVFVQFNETYSRYGGVAQSVTSADLLALYRDIDDVNTAPGTAWMYNNGGWLILSAVIERITGKSLERVMWERIFEPIGMYDSLVRRSDSDFVSNSATPHSLNPAGGFERLYWGLDNCFRCGSGSIHDRRHAVLARAYGRSASRQRCDVGSHERASDSRQRHLDRLRTGLDA